MVLGLLQMQLVLLHLVGFQMHKEPIRLQWVLTVQLKRVRLMVWLLVMGQ